MPIDKCESLSLCPKKVGGGSEHDLDILTAKIIAYRNLRPTRFERNANGL